MKKTLIFVLAGLLLLAGACAGPEKAAEPTQAPAENAEIAGNIYADIAIKDYGTVTVQLDPSAAPATVANFVSLAKDGFYDGLTFHRIIDGFMMQGGAGQGAAQIEGEFSANGHDNPISHVRGVISMARANDPNSASSQFFIVQSDSTYLDG